MVLVIILGIVVGVLVVVREIRRVRVIGRGLKKFIFVFFLIFDVKKNLKIYINGWCYVFDDLDCDDVMKMMMVVRNKVNGLCFDKMK